ncbi:MAG: deoxyribonuclease IV [Trueperaceae bacterium]
MALLGAHVSTAGGVAKAFERGAEIGCDALQIFVKSPSQWRGKALSDADVSSFQSAHAERPQPVVAHAAYLINLGSPNEDVLEKSRAGLADELLRCDRLGVSGLVLHPGAHLGTGAEEGIDRIARALDEVLVTVLESAPELATRVLLENTAGQGSTIGARFEEIAAIRARLDAPERVGVCLDSCHAFAAGYDLTSEDGYEEALSAFDEAIGLERLACIHLNDSKHPLGSRKDRHENIGQGAIGTEFFARVTHDARFEAMPMILETPLGDDEGGHERDLNVLRSL